MKDWIVVADAARARIFVRDKAGKLQVVQEFEHAASRLHEGDLTTDRHGRSFESRGQVGHAMSDSVSPKGQEGLRFAKEVAATLDKARVQHAFDGLMLIAAPAFLGLLRDKLDPVTMGKVTRQIDKNLAHMKPDDIARHLDATPHA